MEIGIDSFAAILPDPVTGRSPSATNRIADLLEEIEVAAALGSTYSGWGNTIAPNSWIPRQRSSLQPRLRAPGQFASQAPSR